MNKRNHRKLTLNAETLRNLSEPPTGEVAVDQTGAQSALVC